MCHLCVIGMIKQFKEYRKNHNRIPWDEFREYNPSEDPEVDFLDSEEFIRFQKEIKLISKEDTKTLGENTQKIFKGRFDEGDVVKVKFVALNGKEEYMWVRILNKKNKTTYRGELGNQPLFKHKNNLKDHDLVNFKVWDIYDKLLED